MQRGWRFLGNHRIDSTDFQSMYFSTVFLPDAIGYYVQALSAPMMLADAVPPILDGHIPGQPDLGAAGHHAVACRHVSKPPPGRCRLISRRILRTSGLENHEDFVFGFEEPATTLRSGNFRILQTNSVMSAPTMSRSPAVVSSSPLKQVP
ncbi:hypothetical protein ACVBEG_27030 [Pseudomonas sp. GG8]